MTITKEKMAEWRKLSDDATPGPWEDSKVTFDMREFRSPDEKFIAAARTAVPALLDEVSDLAASQERERVLRKAAAAIVAWDEIHWHGESPAWVSFGEAILELRKALALSQPTPSKYMETDPVHSFCFGWGSACGHISTLLEQRGLSELGHEILMLAGSPDVEAFEGKPPKPPSP